MRVFICICVSLTLISPQLAFANKNKSGGGGKAAAHPSGGGGPRAVAARPGGGFSHPGGGAAHPGGGFSHPGGGAPHAGGSAISNRTGMGQHNFGSNSAQSRAQTAHTQHGLNANNQSGQHGLNSHGKAGVHTQGGLQNNHAAKMSPAHPVNNRVAVHNQTGAHWRSGLGYRNTHALYAGYHRAWHDRGYWHSHYSSVVYVNGPYWGGHWYWDGGYWFPAWGYDPAFVSYLYDGPIFAYNNLPPDEVVVNVQEALQDQGYYTGNIDGQLGNQTRDALSTYQRDKGLEITAAIDEPTVQSLGLATEES